MKEKPTAIPDLARHHAKPQQRLHVDLEAIIEFHNAFSRRWHLIDETQSQMEGVLKAAGLRMDDVYGLPKQAVARGHPIGSKVWYAAKIISEIRFVRSNINTFVKRLCGVSGPRFDSLGKLEVAQRETYSICYAGLYLGVLLKEADIQISYGKTLDRGNSFETGNKKGRRSKIIRLIDDALQQLGKDATNEAVLMVIKDGVQEVDQEDRLIFWVNDRGHEKTTSFKSFQNRVIERKKLFVQK